MAIWIVGVRLLMVAIAAMLWSVAASSAASAQQKLALLIGNSKYQKATQLDNPVNDVKLMSGVLQKQGFGVSLHTDVDSRSMKRAFSSFFQKVQSAGKDAVVVVYYAGHGVQVRGTNYLIPIDAEIESEADVDLDAVKADSIMEMVSQSGSALNIVVLDACRNNPFRGFRSAARGLAQVDAPAGTLVAFSTAPGSVARDGPRGGNSPYTSALAKAIVEPGLKIEDVFKRVRQIVTGETKNAQVPWESSSLVGDFYPAGRSLPAAQAPAPRVASNDPAPAPPRSEARKQSLRLASAFPASIHAIGPDPAPVIRQIGSLTAGSIEIRTFVAGEIVPSFQVLDAVSKGVIELGWTLFDYHSGQQPAYAPASGRVPFSVPPEKLINWAEGEGKALRDALFARAGFKALPCSMLGTNGVWSKKRLEEPGDLKGLKFRSSGLALKVWQRSGVASVMLPGGELAPALERGVIDGASFGNPQFDEPLGLHQVAKYYYFPSWEQPASIVDLVMTKSRWDGLTASEQQHFEIACSRNLPRSIVAVVSGEKDSLGRLAKQGAQIQSYPAAVWEALRKEAVHVLDEEGVKSADFKRLWDSLKRMQ